MQTIYFSIHFSLRKKIYIHTYTYTRFRTTHQRNRIKISKSRWFGGDKEIQKERGRERENLSNKLSKYSHHRRGHCSTDRVVEGVTVADDGHRPPRWPSVDCGCAPPSRWPNGPIHRPRWLLGPCSQFRFQPYLLRPHLLLHLLHPLRRRLRRLHHPPRRPPTTRKRLSAKQKKGLIGYIDRLNRSSIKGMRGEGKVRFEHLFILCCVHSVFPFLRRERGLFFIFLSFFIRFWMKLSSANEE